jgi:hypothetical protein
VLLRRALQQVQIGKVHQRPLVVVWSIPSQPVRAPAPCRLAGRLPEPATHTDADQRGQPLAHSCATERSCIRAPSRPHPLWACNGRVNSRSSTQPRIVSVAFFMNPPNQKSCDARFLFPRVICSHASLV